MRKMISALIMTLVIGALFSLSGYAMEAIQTQPSSDGNFEASLTSVKIKRDVLTIRVMVKNVSANKAEMQCNYKEVYYTDVEDKKKYFVLKDSEGQYIAGPKRGGAYGGYFGGDIDPDGQKIMWMKFPAPPETTTTVDIFVPGILPFEEIQLTR